MKQNKNEKLIDVKSDKSLNGLKNKLRVHQKAAIKSLTSHSDKIIAKLSQIFDGIFALISQLETADFCEIIAKLSSECFI